MSRHRHKDSDLFSKRGCGLKDTFLGVRLKNRMYSEQRLLTLLIQRGTSANTGQAERPGPPDRPRTKSRRKDRWQRGSGGRAQG